MPTTSNEVVSREELGRAMEYVKAYHDSTASGGGGGGGGSVAIQMVAAIPNCYRRAELMTPNKTTITVHANTQVNINGSGYISTEDVELKLGDVLSESERMGTDMYVYACQPADETSTEPVFVLSANSTVPDGYDADNSRKIGGFHCLCADVGEIDGHELSEYVRGDIIPNTVWDLQFRASCENEGMAYIKGRDIWVDIYLASWDGEKLVSVFGESVVTGTAGGKYMHGEMFNEQFAFVNKKIIWRDDFAVFAKGSNEQTCIQGAAAPGTTGSHVDTAGRRMISNFGIEDCCGEYSQWAEMSNGANSGSWGNNLYDSSVDDKNYGGTVGAQYRFLVGGWWNYPSYAGSRSLYADGSSVGVHSIRAGRGAAGPRTVNTL